MSAYSPPPVAKKLHLELDSQGGMVLPLNLTSTHHHTHHLQPTHYQQLQLEPGQLEQLGQLPPGGGGGGQVDLHETSLYPVTSSTTYTHIEQVDCTQGVGGREGEGGGE